MHARFIEIFNKTRLLARCSTFLHPICVRREPDRENLEGTSFF